jgi:16S rRNA (guanine966-N2)-methyltransferase
MIKQSKKQTNNDAKGNIRIIAGTHRGRKLPVLLAPGLRPTTDRVKETVFNWLMPYIQASNCLDCFAGSGSLGFEALSRGAEHVTMLELNKSAALQLQQNQRLLKTDNMTINQTDALLFLKQKSHDKLPPFDLVFIDPPFRQQLVEPVCQLLDSNWLVTDALIYIEMETECNNPSLPLSWQLLKEKKAGQVKYQLYKKG